VAGYSAVKPKNKSFKYHLAQPARMLA